MKPGVESRPPYSFRGTILILSRRRFSVGLLSALAAFACSSSSGPNEPLPDAELTVLFVGNSLTYTNSLPALVQTIAEAAGHTLAYYDRSQPNFSLEDHFFTGFSGDLQATEPDIVVLQQGPSSLPQNQTYLREWTETLAESIEGAGARPALFMVWPAVTAIESFDAVRESYAAAAEAVNGMFIPAGAAWERVWAARPNADLYSQDGFHPSATGSVVAALTIYRMLFNESVADLPVELVPSTPGLPVIDLGPDLAPVVYQAVEEAVLLFGRP
jgi:hypothetical protein